MARNIGSVEVTVDANTGKVVAKSKVAGEAAGEAFADAFESEMGEVEGRELLARLKVIRERAQATLGEVELGLALDEGDARATIAEMRARLEAADLEAPVELSPGDISTAEMNANVRAAQLVVGDILVDMDTEFDLAGALADKAALDAAMGTITVDIDPEVDTRKLALLRARLKSWAFTTGDQSGDRWHAGFLGGFSGDNTVLAVQAVALFGDEIAEALEGAIAASTAVVSSGISAIGGAAGGAFANVFAFAAAIGAVSVGTQGVGDALGLVNDEFDRIKEDGGTMALNTGALGTALDDLAPSAETFVRKFADVRGELGLVREEVQQELFSGLDSTLQGFIDNTLPDLSGALVIAAGSVNEFVRELGAVTEDADFVVAMEAIDPALDNAFDALVLLSETMVPFLSAAGPAAEALAKWLEDGALAMRDWTINNQAEIEEFLLGGITSLKLWGTAVVSFGDLLGTIFGSGTGPGDLLLASLNNMIERWDVFLQGPKGQSALEDFFESGTGFLNDVKPALEGLQEAVDILTGGDEEGGFAGLMDSLGDSLPAVAQALELIGDLELGQTFLDVIALFEPLLDLLNSLPDEILSSVGAFLLLSKGVQALTVKLTGLSLASPVLFGIAAALTAGLLIMDAFGSGEEEAQRRTEELTRSLANNLDVAVQSAEGFNEATLGLDAFNAALTEGAEGEKLVIALGKLGRTARDARATLLELAEDPLQGLTNLAISADEADSSFSLTGEQAGILAKIVSETDDSFENLGESLFDAHEESSGVRDIMRDLGVAIGEDSVNAEQLAEALGLTEGQLQTLLVSMEAVEDQVDGNKAVLEEMALAELEVALGAGTMERGMLRAAAEALGLEGSLTEILEDTDNLIPLYDKYAELMGLAESATRGNTEANDDLISSSVLIQEEIARESAAFREKMEAQKEAQEAAFDAYQEEQRAATQLLNVVSDVASADFGLPQAVVDSFISLGESFDATSEKADALSSALDILFGSFPDFQAATSDAEQALDDFRDQLSNASEAEGWTNTLNLQNEAGRENAAAARDAAAAILEFAVAGTQAGEDTAFLNDEVARMRDELVNGLIPSFEDTTASEEEARAAAEAYVDTLLGAPEVLETVISQPGLVNALLNAEDLTLLYNDAGNPVITEFEAIGLDPAIAESEEFVALLELMTGQDFTAQVAVEGASDAVTAAEDVTGAIEETDEATADPTISVSSQIGTIALIFALQQEITDLNAMTADPQVSLTTYDPVFLQLTSLQDEVIELDGLTATPSVSVPNYQNTHDHLVQLADDVEDIPDSKSVFVSLPNIALRTQEVNDLRLAIEALRDRTVTVTTNSIGGAPGAMAGMLVGGPMNVNVGEHGLAEAIVPLELPLSQVDPSVRWMAEAIRGEGVGPRVQVTQYITAVSADPEQVAEQVLNRAAAVIGG